MRYQTSVAIAAPADRVWTIMSDIRHWPGWTPTVTAVDGPPPPLRRGQEFSIEQPGRRPTSYVVEEVAEGRSFTWGSGNALLRQRAEHVVTPAGASSEVLLVFDMSGALGSLLAALVRGRIRSFVDTEAASLKARVEQGD